MFAAAGIPQLQALVHANGSDELAHMLLGRAYLAEGRHMQAVAEFRRVVELNPDFAEAWEKMAEAYTRVGVLKEAAAALRHGIRAAEEFGVDAAAVRMREALEKQPEEATLIPR